MPASPTEPAEQTEMSAVEAITAISEGKERILREVRKVIVGQNQVVEDVITSFFAGGHCLITGVPGLAKTLLISSLGRALDLRFRRVQFTPDLMPADITGTEVLEEDRTTGSRNMKFRPGPVFTNILLADEINRTPPKTQAALLEAMQEHQVTVSGNTYLLEEPFFVLATQNPIEQEGTYPCRKSSRTGSCSASSSTICRRTRSWPWSTPPPASTCRMSPPASTARP